MQNLELIDSITGEKLDKKFFELKVTQKEIDLLRFKFYCKECKNSNFDESKFWLQNRDVLENDKEYQKIFFIEFGIKDVSSFLDNIKNIKIYPPIFYDKKFRKIILQEQNYKCFVCEADLKPINPHLHHIDYNIKNCSKDNLVFLCPRCHGKTNFNRKFWEKYFKEKKYGDNKH